MQVRSILPSTLLFDFSDFFKIAVIYFRGLAVNRENRENNMSAKKTCFTVINSTSYKVGKSLESLLDFSWLMHPTTKIQYCELSDISVNSFKELLTPLHFVSTRNEQDLKQLLFEY